MKVTFEGREWYWDPEADIDVQEATVLWMAYGMSVDDWLDGMKQIDPRAWCFTYWLMRRRNGIKEPIAELKFPLLTFVRTYIDAAKSSGEGTEDIPEEAPKDEPSSLPAAPASPEPPTPTATTPQPQPQPVPWAGTGYTRSPSPGYGVPTSSISPTSAT